MWYSRKRHRHVAWNSRAVAAGLLIGIVVLMAVLTLILTVTEAQAGVTRYRGETLAVGDLVTQDGSGLAVKTTASTDIPLGVVTNINIFGYSTMVNIVNTDNVYVNADEAISIGEFISPSSGTAGTVVGEATMQDNSFAIATAASAGGQVEIRFVTLNPDSDDAPNSAHFLTDQAEASLTAEVVVNDEASLESLLTDVSDVFTDNDTIPEANIHADIHRDAEVKDGDLCSFDDPDSKFVATDLDEALSELYDPSSSGLPNDATDSSINWDRLMNMPSGFVDETDDIGILVDTSFPGSPTGGQLFYHSTLKILFQYDGSAWYAKESFAAVAVYVNETSGSDAAGQGFGSGASATKTVQYAIDHCIPSLIGGDVTMSITAENYSGEDPKVVGKALKGEYYIYVNGTWSQQLAEATVDSGTAGTGGTQGTLVDAEPAWADDAYNNMWIVFESDTTTTALQGDIVLIDDTTDSTNTLTIVGCFDAAPSAGDTYTIQTPGTVFDTFYVGPNQKNVVLQKVHVLLDTSPHTLTGSGAEIAMNYCKVSHASAATVSLGTFSKAYLTGCFLNKTKMYAGNPAHWLVASSKALVGSTQIMALKYGAVGTITTGTIFDDNGQDNHGLQAQGNSVVSCFSTAALGYVRIRNCSQAGDIGVYALQGGQVVDTSTVQYSGNTTDESAVAGSYGYID